VSEHAIAHVRLGHNDAEREYVVMSEEPDGTLVLRPDTTAVAIRRRLGSAPATVEEFEADYGRVLPPDGEG
jgi:hypothetical protein